MLKKGECALMFPCDVCFFNSNVVVTIAKIMKWVSRLADIIF
jgi:hypothetical protein